jgi:hypothetical protein
MGHKPAGEKQSLVLFLYALSGKPADKQLA